MRLFDVIAKKVKEFPVTLTFDCCGKCLKILVFNPRSQSELRGKEARLFFSAGQAHSHACAAPCDQDARIPLDHLSYISKFLGFGNDQLNLRIGEKGCFILLQDSELS